MTMSDITSGSVITTEPGEHGEYLAAWDGDSRVSVYRNTTSDDRDWRFIDKIEWSPEPESVTHARYMLGELLNSWRSREATKREDMSNDQRALQAVEQAVSKVDEAIALLQRTLVYKSGDRADIAEASNSLFNWLDQQGLKLLGQVYFESRTSLCECGDVLTPGHPTCPDCDMMRHNMEAVSGSNV